MALIAHDVTGQRVAVADVVLGAAYTCPECGWRMAIHAGAIRTRHFAHYPGAPACTATEERAEHRALKIWLAEQFARGSNSTGG